MTDDIDLSKDLLFDLHLQVLADILNGEKFSNIRQKYTERFGKLSYLDKANQHLLSFHNGQLVGAYPISPNQTDFKITVDDIGSGYAMCAIDALGVAFTFMKTTMIETQSIDTGEDLIIEIDPKSYNVDDYDIYVAYQKIGDECTNAAIDQCPTINFYSDPSNIPVSDNVVSYGFNKALDHAKRRFSQKSIRNCFSQEPPILFGGSLSSCCEDC